MSSYEIYCKIRDEKGMKDAAVAAASGVSKPTFSDWKSGKSEPKTAKLIKIADALGLLLHIGKKPTFLRGSLPVCHLTVTYIKEKPSPMLLARGKEEERKSPEDVKVFWRASSARPLF